MRSTVHRRSGFTLLEIMIATAVTLLMMISMVQIFKVIGDSMKQGRAALQMNNTLRSVTTRLRQDLSNLTVRIDPPSDNSSGGGYFMYFDGGMTDYTAALSAGDAPRSNRFGDCDDILMFTAKAGSGWFSGQVPGYIISGVAGDTAPVVITSQLAEIAVFARPVVSPTAAAGTAFDDADGNGFPDSYRLHYRVLLIRPDLNVVGVGPTRSLPLMSIPNATPDLPTTMGSYFANCDLSMRRVYDGDPGTPDLIAANSLEDLANPANRFAHYQYSLAGIASNASCTMPLLVLDPIANTVFSPFSTGPYPESNPTGAGPMAPYGTPAQLQGANGNFLSSAYVLGGARTGEDVIANNVVAFDVKGFDPGVPVIGTVGADNNFGVQTQVTPPTWNGVVGQDGSDDLILTPNDPGYLAAFDVASPRNPQVISYGEYVDLMWGRKALHSLTGLGMTYTGNIGTNTASGARLVSSLSGIEGAPTVAFTEGLLRSGKLLVHSGAGTNSFVIIQPTYDTWTTTFDGNGTYQGPLNGISGVASDLGIVDVNALVRKNGAASIDATGAVDMGTDGLDNNGIGGIDDTTERETLPPFPSKLRGIKVSVRIEDLNSRQIKQMSVSSEFATQ